MGTVGGNVLQERRCFYFNQSQYWRQTVAPCRKLGGDTCYQIPKAKKCGALYYSDLAPIFLAYDARARIYDGETYEERPLEDLIRSHTQNHDKRHLVTGFIIPLPRDGTKGTYLKYSVRGSIDFALSNLGISFSPGDQEDKKPTIRIFAGAVSPDPVRLHGTEETVLNSLPDPNQNRMEIINTGINELESLSSPIRETTVSMAAKKNSLLIIAEALRNFLPSLGP